MRVSLTFPMSGTPSETKAPAVRNLSFPVNSQWKIQGNDQCNIQLNSGTLRYIVNQLFSGKGSRILHELKMEITLLAEAHPNERELAPYI